MCEKETIKLGWKKILEDSKHNDYFAPLKLQQAKKQCTKKLERDIKALTQKLAIESVTPLVNAPATAKFTMNGW